LSIRFLLYVVKEREELKGDLKKRVDLCTVLCNRFYIVKKEINSQWIEELPEFDVKEFFLLFDWIA